LLKEKIRIDEYLLSSDLIPDKSKITSLILSGSVLVNDKVVTKVGTIIYKSDSVRLREKIKSHVSRGAYKLLGGFSAFQALTVEGLVCLDLGASTGGFTEVLLEKKASHVYAIDVGYGQLAQKIANDSRVTVLDRMHVKDLTLKNIEIRTESIFVTTDLSFISLTVVFPYLARLAMDDLSLRWSGLSLVKPQFELHPRYLEKGIVRDRRMQLQAVRSVWRSIKNSNPEFHFLGLSESPIQGADGNHEFLLHWSFGSNKKR
jgi:23S rRNA (cytidine1920-2'-O)/16S rRNA (cytidine1409-2'-O)-methyltransferase